MGTNPVSATILFVILSKMAGLTSELLDTAFTLLGRCIGLAYIGSQSKFV